MLIDKLQKAAYFDRDTIISSIEEIEKDGVGINVECFDVSMQAVEVIYCMQCGEEGSIFLTCGKDSNVSAIHDNFSQLWTKSVGEEMKAAPRNFDFSFFGQVFHQQMVDGHVDVLHRHGKAAGVESIKRQKQPQKRRYSEAKQKNDDFPPVKQGRTPNL